MKLLEKIFPKFGFPYQMLQQTEILMI